MTPEKKPCSPWGHANLSNQITVLVTVDEYVNKKAYVCPPFNVECTRCVLVVRQLRDELRFAFQTQTVA